MEVYSNLDWLCAEDWSSPVLDSTDCFPGFEFLELSFRVASQESFPESPFPALAPLCPGLEMLFLESGLLSPESVTRCRAWALPCLELD